MRQNRFGAFSEEKLNQKIGLTAVNPIFLICGA